MNEDRVFKPFLDIPIDWNPNTNPTMVGVLADTEQFKKQLVHTLGPQWLKSLLIGGGTAVALAALLVATGGTAVFAIGPLSIVYGGTTLGTAVLSGIGGGTVAALTHRGCHWFKSKKVKEVPSEIPGSIDRLACFVAATVFRVYYEKDSEHIRRRFEQWGYADKWAESAMTILQRKDIDIDDLIKECSTKEGLRRALQQCKLSSDVIDHKMFKELCGLNR